MSNSRIRAVEESEYGMYVWRMPDGTWVGDDEGNYMNIMARKGDLDKIIALRKAARYYGVEEGEPLFLSNRRRVTASEHERQKERLIEGKIADEYDYAALQDGVNK